ncbi:type 1 glutamine amidotransferase domain-containing protein [Jannaschia formosa]|uniref:type 1 glutamine amidotransferase domain-containing protein n=1 Tax=Jannaschia formosa TaxID=2259592 RepID=UPI000E1BF3CE|nr:type 1 glutamine amidotransferase domain-containing protein [Jannaschia formosa]TFL19883.1 type 1 glutamine amidotransferase [Jannaschia formosa]
MPAITRSKILILATDGFEQSELEVPRDQLRDQGATVHVATPDGEAIMGWDTKDWGREAKADLALADVDVDAYDALVLPGGQINPDILRVNEDAIALIRTFAERGKPIAAICHAPWLLIEAGLVEGKEVTSYHSIRTDLRNAGATVVDRSAVTSGGLITSRNPDDLDDFVAAIQAEVESGASRHAA